MIYIYIYIYLEINEFRKKLHIFRPPLYKSFPLKAKSKHITTVLEKLIIIFRAPKIGTSRYRLMMERKNNNSRNYK